MAILSRDQLCSIFVNGAIPSQQDFCDLIDSSLNRRDDHFFGFWQKGMKYCHGDVVIYDKSLYLLRIPDDEDCPPDTNGDSTDPPAEDPGCICSTIPPPEDSNRWCPLELMVDDKDWDKIEVEGEVVTVYNLRARIGIGTDEPQSRLEITDGEHGSLQLEPNAAAKPLMRLLRFNTDEGDPGTPDGQVDYQLDQEVEWVTNSLGYAFYQEGSAQLPEAAQVDKSIRQAPMKQPAELPVLLFLTSNAGRYAMAGIGTHEPKGLLDAHQAERGQMVVNPGTAKDPGILLANLQPAGNGSYLLSGVTQEAAFLQTDAAGGFRLKKGDDISTLYKTDSLDTGESLVAVTRDGDVGIGTEDPQSKLEVKEENSGTIRLDLSNDNPAVSTINLRPTRGLPVTYHAFGVDDDAGTFITNAPGGYVFKKGGAYGNFNNEVNINHGDKLVYISDTGKVGVQTPEIPEDYDLEVEGQVKSLTAYLETDGANIEQTGDLSEDDVLDMLENLHPIRFKWKNHTNASEEGEQLGFRAQNVFEVEPRLVKKSGGKKAVAYANMTALLVQAIKEQQVLIKQLEQRICDLEEGQSGTAD